MVKSESSSLLQKATRAAVPTCHALQMAFSKLRKFLYHAPIAVTVECLSPGLQCPILEKVLALFFSHNHCRTLWDKKEKKRKSNPPVIGRWSCLGQWSILPQFILAPGRPPLLLKGFFLAAWTLCIVLLHLSQSGVFLQVADIKHRVLLVRFLEISSKALFVQSLCGCDNYVWNSSPPSTKENKISILETFLLTGSQGFLHRKGIAVQACWWAWIMHNQEKIQTQNFREFIFWIFPEKLLWIFIFSANTAWYFAYQDMKWERKGTLGYRAELAHRWGQLRCLPKVAYWRGATICTHSNSLVTLT